MCLKSLYRLIKMLWPLLVKYIQDNTYMRNHIIFTTLNLLEVEILDRKTMAQFFRPLFMAFNLLWRFCQIGLWFFEVMGTFISEDNRIIYGFLPEASLLHLFSTSNCQKQSYTASMAVFRYDSYLILGWLHMSTGDSGSLPLSVHSTWW